MGKNEISKMRRELKRLSGTPASRTLPVWAMARDAIKPDYSDPDAFVRLLALAIEMMHVPDGCRPDAHAQKMTSEGAKELRSDLRHALIEKDLVRFLESLLPAVTPEKQAAAAFLLLRRAMKSREADCKEALNLTTMAALCLIWATEQQREIQVSHAATFGVSRRGIPVAG